VNKDKENMQKRKGSHANETDTNVKASDPKQGDIADKKINVRSHSDAREPIHPSTGQIPKNNGIMREEVRKGKPEVKKFPQNPEAKGDGSRKQNTKSDHLKDEPQSKEMNSTTRTVTIPSKTTRTNKTQTGRESLMEKNVTQSSDHKPSKTSKLDSKNTQSFENRKITEKEKTTQKSQSVVNATITAAPDGTKLPHNKTSIHGSGKSTRKTGGLGSVKAVNISSNSFTVIWSAPHGMFKNFTVIRTEPRTEGDEDGKEGFEEEVLGRDKTSAARNVTEVHSESTNTTASSAKAAGPRGKAETKRISMVVPGNVRSVEFSNLRANTRYFLQVYGTAADRRSNSHRVTVTTG